MGCSSLSPLFLPLFSLFSSTRLHGQIFIATATAFPAHLSRPAPEGSQMVLRGFSRWPHLALAFLTAYCLLLKAEQG